MGLLEEYQKYFHKYGMMLKRQFIFFLLHGECLRTLKQGYEKKKLTTFEIKAKEYLQGVFF